MKEKHEVLEFIGKSGLWKLSGVPLKTGDRIALKGTDHEAKVKVAAATIQALLDSHRQKMFRPVKLEPKSKPEKPKPAPKEEERS